MKIWLINPFDPLPGEVEQLGRYARFAQALTHAGHQVVWWSSDFSHRFKRPVNATAIAEAARAWNIEVRLLHAPSYPNNISPRRIWSHRKLAEAFRAAIKELEPPDLIFASSPPLELARDATRYATQWHIPSIVDIQDQWPDNFARFFPKGLRWTAPLALEHLYRVEQDAYAAATAITGVAHAYINRGQSVGGPNTYNDSFPLGLDLADFDAAAARGKQLAGHRWQKPANQTWLIYSGSLSHSYDVLTVVAAAERAAIEFGPNVQFFISGTGDLATKVRDTVATKNLTNVKILGFMDFPEYVYLLTQCDIGFNAAFEDALIYLPNKVFYYFAAGLAVLNTIPGECSSIISQNKSGCDYTAGDPESCMNAIRDVIQSPQHLASMKSAARQLAVRQFDRSTIARDMVRYVENVAKSWAASHTH